MLYFLDTEFHEEPGFIELISLALVAQDGRELYLENREYDQSRAHGWLWENVLPSLEGGSYAVPRAHIAEAVLEFVNPQRHGEPEFWGFYCDYDWVVFCWLFGAMVDLPEGFPMYCRDLKQWADALGNPRLPKPEGGDRHNALVDARAIRDGYDSLMEIVVEREDKRRAFIQGMAEKPEPAPKEERTFAQRFGDLLLEGMESGAQEKTEEDLDSRIRRICREERIEAMKNYRDRIA